MTIGMINSHFLATPLIPSVREFVHKILRIHDEIIIRSQITLEFLPLLSPTLNSYRYGGPHLQMGRGNSQGAFTFQVVFILGLLFTVSYRFSYVYGGGTAQV